MDGVTILQTIPAYFESFPGTLTLIMLIAGVVFMFIGCTSLDKSYLIGIGLAILTFAVCIGVKSHPEQYKVTIDDSVSYNEFTDHYKIIETDGKILTVEERKGE